MAKEEKKEKRNKLSIPRGFSNTVDTHYQSEEKKKKKKKK